MQKTIKDKISTQIYFHQHLLNYDDSDSSHNSEEQNYTQFNNSIKTINIDHSVNQNNTNYCSQIILNNHQEMKQKRRKVLRQLQNQTKIQSSECRPLKSMAKQQQIPNQSKQVIELKCKLAQLFKQSQLKTSKINLLEQLVSKSQIRKNQLQCLLYEKEKLLEEKQKQDKNKEKMLEQKQKQEKKAEFEIQKLTEEYQRRLHQLEEEIQMKNTLLEEAMRAIDTRDQKIDELQNIVYNKSHPSLQIKQDQFSVQEYIVENQKLKQYISKLLQLLQEWNKNVHKQKNKKAVQDQQKKKNTRSLSMGFENLNPNIINKTISGFYKLTQTNQSSNHSKSFQLKKQKRKNLTQPSLLFLATQVEHFLKKWHIAQNNHKFVNSLTEFINVYTDKCIRQNRTRIQNQYKNLKKQIQRKANHSLALQQVIKEKSIQLKSNPSQTFQSLKKTDIQNDSKTKKTFLSADNISILIPASNKQNSQQKNFPTMSSFWNDKRKDEIGYNNLEKSIRLHHKKSIDKEKTLQNLQEKKISSQKGINFGKKPHRKSKTEFSLDAEKMYLAAGSISLSKWKKKNGKIKSYDFPFKKQRII